MIETFSEQDLILVRYLLDELDTNEAVELEDEMLLDDELFNRALVVEMILIDGYVRKEMTPEESRRFKERFLEVPGNGDKVNRAQTFHRSVRLLHDKDQFAPQPVREQGWPLAGFFQRPLPALASIAAAVLLIAAVVVVFEIRRRANNTDGLVTNSAPPVVGNVNQFGNMGSDRAVTGGTPTPQLTPRPEGLGSELAKNVHDYTQTEYVSRQNWGGGERGTRAVHIILRPGVTNLVLSYELLDDESSKKETYGVTIKDQFGERIWPQGNKPKEDVKPVYTNEKIRRKVISISAPASVFKDRGPYLFEVDDPYIPSRSFTVRQPRG